MLSFKSFQRAQIPLTCTGTKALALTIHSTKKRISAGCMSKDFAKAKWIDSWFCCAHSSPLPWRPLLPYASYILLHPCASFWFTCAAKRYSPTKKCKLLTVTAPMFVQFAKSPRKPSFPKVTLKRTCAAVPDVTAVPSSVHSPAVLACWSQMVQFLSVR